MYYHACMNLFLYRSTLLILHSLSHICPNMQIWNEDYESVWFPKASKFWGSKFLIKIWLRNSFPSLASHSLGRYQLSILPSAWTVWLRHLWLHEECERNDLKDRQAKLITDTLLSMMAEAWMQNKKNVCEIFLNYLEHYSWGGCLSP